MGEKTQNGHILVVPYPTQGHINPMLKLSKRLVSKGLKTSIAITTFIINSMNLPPSIGSVQILPISDGYDGGGFVQAGTIKTYIEGFEEHGSKSLAELILKHRNSPNPIDCFICDSFTPWALDVAKEFGLMGVSFFTPSCAVNYMFYKAFHGVLKLPITEYPVSIKGLPPLDLQDMPSFIYDSESYPDYYKLVFSQYSNVEKADWLLVNTFYELEKEAVDAMAEVCPILTIGPTIPSAYLDKRIEDDNDYGLNLFTSDSSSTTCTKWLSTKPPLSVVYVSFGSLVKLGQVQMEEIAWGLKDANFPFIWALRSSEAKNLPQDFEVDTDKGLVVNWCPQLEALSSEALGCFFTHCGWNSTFEALSLAAPMVVMPQWTDQPMDAKFVEDVWMTGIRVRVDEDGIVRRSEIESCIRQVMEGEKGREIRANAQKWKDVAKKAMSENGTSNKNIESFVAELRKQIC